MKKSLISLGTAAAIAVGNLLPAKSAHAATDCTYKVLYVYTEAGVASPKVAIGMVGASSPWIWIPFADAAKNVIVSQAQAALITGADVQVQFAASGVTCSTTQGRTDVSAFWQFGS